MYFKKNRPHGDDSGPLGACSVFCVFLYIHYYSGSIPRGDESGPMGATARTRARPVSPLTSRMKPPPSFSISMAVSVLML